MLKIFPSALQNGGFFFPLLSTEIKKGNQTGLGPPTRLRKAEGTRARSARAKRLSWREAPLANRRAEGRRGRPMRSRNETSHLHGLGYSLVCAGRLFFSSPVREVNRVAVIRFSLIFPKKKALS